MNITKSLREFAQNCGHQCYLSHWPLCLKEAWITVRISQLIHLCSSSHGHPSQVNLTVSGPSTNDCHPWGQLVNSLSGVKLVSSLFSSGGSSDHQDGGENDTDTDINIEHARVEQRWRQRLPLYHQSTTGIHALLVSLDCPDIVTTGAYLTGF